MDSDPEGEGLLDISGKTKKSPLGKPPLSTDSTISEFSDDSEDEIQDWSVLSSVPKRGHKDFEPLLSENDTNQLSVYDQNNLNKSRNMRFSALNKKRGLVVNLKNLDPSTIYINAKNNNDLFMIKPKGKFLENMGVIDKNNRCNLGYEEAIYLIERGSCIAKLWDENKSKNESFERLPPLTLQAVYSLLIDNDEQLDKYMVYSNLKRDGYIITRHEEFDGLVSDKIKEINKPANELFKQVKMSFWTKTLQFISDFFDIKFPFKFAFSYYNIFTYLHSRILPQSILKKKESNVDIKKYNISFNVWKPTVNFKKKNPPLPDYQIVILKSSDKLPKITEIKSILERADSKSMTVQKKSFKKYQHNKNNNKIKSPSEWNYDSSINMNNLKHNPNKFTFAIIDNGTVNFIILSDCNFVAEGPCWRDHWTVFKPHKKHFRNRNFNKHTANSKPMNSDNSTIGNNA